MPHLAKSVGRRRKYDTTSITKRASGVQRIEARVNMEILHSKILLIEGRQYINYHQDDSEQDDYHDFDSRQHNNPVIEQPSSNQHYRETMACPNALFRHVIGFRGQTIRRLQDETGAHIIVPRGGNASGLTVEAKSQKSLEAAITRIQLLLSEKRWKETFQHFISIPLTSESIKDGFEQFKAQVLQKYGDDKGVEERLFQDKNKIHLTIGSLVLLDNSDCDKAVEVMQDIQKSDIFKEATATHVQVRGVEYMNDDPGMVDVLYAKVQCVEKPGYLQKLADYIVCKFVQAGLMKQEHDHVKLHATVMNTIRTMERAPTREKGQKKNLKRETFDARNILSDFSDYEFGTFPLEDIHISRRFTTDKSGYYENIYAAKIH